MSLFEKAETGMGKLIDTDKDGSMLDDVLSFTAGGVFDVTSAVVDGLGFKGASKAIDTFGKPIKAGAEDYGDMLSDFFGTRGDLSSETTDEDYKKVFEKQGAKGEFDGFGTEARKTYGAGSQGGAIGGALTGAMMGGMLGGPIGSLLGGMAGAGVGALLPNLLGGGGAPQPSGPNHPMPIVPRRPGMIDRP